MKLISGYDKAYYVDRNGNIYDEHKKLISPCRFDNGYIYCVFLLNGEEVNRLVHVEVARAYIPNPQNKLLVNHKDLDKSNPNCSNLEWVTHSENQHHQIKMRRGGKIKNQKNKTMAHKRVHVKKGRRLPHGYNTIKAKNKNEVYGSKDVHIDKGYRIRHGVKTVPAADPNAYYKSGGDIKSLQQEIAEYEALLSDSSVPQDEKDFATSEIADLKEKIAKIGATEPKAPANKKASPPEKAKKTPAASPATKTPSYNCDELIKAEKERRAAKKEAADKKAKEPVKTDATKNKEAIEKVTDKIETSIEKRLEKGQVSKSEIQKLIAETETLLKLLQSALKKV